MQVGRCKPPIRKGPTMTTSDLRYLTKITYKDYNIDQVCYIDPMRAELVAAVLKDVKSITNVEIHRYVFIREEGN